MKEQKYNPVVILGGNVNGIGIVRSFQNTKIPVYVLINDNDIIRYSRFCKAIKCPDPDKKEFGDFLMSFCTSLQQKPVVFATSDLFLMPLIHHKENLREVAFVPTCDKELFDKLIEKKYLYSFAEQVGVPCPKTKTLLAEEVELTVANDMLYPLIIKPSVNLTFKQTFGQKALLAANEGELAQFIKDVKKHNYKGPLIIQEYIPGNMTTLYTITSYADADSRIRGYSIGHKIRQYPAKTGTITAGLVEHVQEILDMSRRFVKAVGFYGISNIEYKYDERDGKYKLMEINPRTGWWNLSVLESGVNLPLMAYRDILGEPIREECNPNGRLIWAYTIFDMLISLRGYKSMGDTDEALSFNQWRKSLQGCRKVDALFKWNDPLPSIVDTSNKLFYSVKKLIKKA